MSGDGRAELTLADGSPVTVTHLAPPVDECRAEQLHRFINIDLAEPFHRRVLRGEWHDARAMHYIVAAVRGTPAATCWYALSPANRYAGCMAGVVTQAAFRRRGLAAALCRHAVDDFDRRGGRALYLACANETARRIYERLGFRRLRGRLMWRAPSVHDEEEYFGGGAADYRTPLCAWSDMGRVTPLLVYPHACRIVDWKANVVSRRYRPGRRCAGLFWDVWDSVRRAGGRWRLLETPDGRVVGAGDLCPEGPTTGVVDFVVHPVHHDGAARLLDVLRADARAMGLRRLQARFAATDADKAALARKFGFTLVSRGGPGLGMVVYQRALP